MGLLSELASDAGARVRKVGGLDLLTGADALRVLDLCAERGVQALGLEGFRVHQATVTPIEHAIADFSDTVAPDQAIDEARELLCELETEALWFELVLTDPPIEPQPAQDSDADGSPESSRNQAPIATSK